MKKSQEPIDIAEKEEEAKLILAPDISEMFCQHPILEDNYDPRGVVQAEELVDLAKEITDDEVETRLMDVEDIKDMKCRNRIQVLTYDMKKRAYLHPDSNKDIHEVKTTLHKIRQMPLEQRATFMNEVAQGAFSGKESGLLDRELRGWGREDLINLYRLYTQQREYKQMASRVAFGYILGEDKMDLNKMVNKIAKSIMAFQPVAWYKDTSGWNMSDSSRSIGLIATVEMSSDKNVKLDMTWVDIEDVKMGGGKYTDNSIATSITISGGDDLDRLVKEIHTAMYHFAALHGGKEHYQYKSKNFKWTNRSGARGTMPLSVALKKSLGLEAPKPEPEPTEFNNTLKEFVAYVQALSDKHYKDNFENLTPTKFTVDMGQRYARIVKTDSGDSRSVYCFVDKSNGDILKAASWRAPAKHARGNIYNKGTWIHMSPYGAPYMR
jgi:hypothetical protein